MTKIPTSQSQNADLSRWSSTRLGDARSNTSLVAQFVYRSSARETHAYAHSKVLTRGQAASQYARSRRLPSPTSSAALKSP
jgi:hypothetical protein